MKNPHNTWLLCILTACSLLLGCEETPNQTNQPVQEKEASKAPLLLTPVIKLAQDHVAPGTPLDIEATIHSYSNVTLKNAMIRVFKNDEISSGTAVVEKEIPNSAKEFLQTNESMTTFVSMTA